MGPFDFPVGVEDAAARGRALSLLRDKGVRLPTFGELAEPRRAPVRLRQSLSGIGPDEPDPGNLYRIHWYNNEARRGLSALPAYVEIPPALSGVEARIIVMLGALFPMIHAHKVLAAYACLAPRLVAGRFDPVRQRAVWPSTGNYCRGGIAVSRILGCRGVAVLPEGMSQERFDWLQRWVVAESDIIRTPGTESNVKEIYDACAALQRDPINEIVNQFSEFGNYLAHWRCTGPALEAIFTHLRKSRADLTLAAYVSASGSSGTLAAGDYLKSRHGARIAAVEAVECPTLLKNGYGEHNIQGIGDKHVPLIHNVMNTDVVVGVSDRATDALNAVFNSQAGRRYLDGRLGESRAIIAKLSYFGLSSLANILASIKLAKHFSLGPDQLILTVATDGAELYASEVPRYLRRSHNARPLDAQTAAELFGTHMIGTDADHVLETTSRDRERIFNLGYFTWVEQQGLSLADFDRRKSQAFWMGLHELVPQWDEMITAFNRDSGMQTAA
jgi:cysteine synthase A